MYQLVHYSEYPEYQNLIKKETELMLESDAVMTKYFRGEVEFSEAQEARKKMDEVTKEIYKYEAPFVEEEEEDEM